MRRIRRSDGGWGNGDADALDVFELESLGVEVLALHAMAENAIKDHEARKKWHNARPK